MQSPSSSSSSSSSRVPGYSPSDYSPSAMHHHPGHHPPPSSHHHALSAASAGSHHHPPPPAHPHQSVFDHPHLAHYAASGLHHLPSAAAAYPQLHHGLHTSAASSTQAGHPQSHYSHHHHHLPPHLKRDIHLDSSLGGSSDEEHLGDVKPPGLGSSSATSSGVGGSAEAGSGSLRGGGGRGGGLKSPGDASGGKKTKGRVKIKMEFIDNKLRRYTTFSKRKTGIMKKAYELSTLTGTQVMLLVASETGHVYTFATRKLQPMITSDAGKALIQTCLNSPDPLGGPSGGDQRMSATGYEETELTYNVSADEESQKVRQMMYNTTAHYSPSSSSPGIFSPLSPNHNNNNHHHNGVMYPPPSPSPSSSHPAYPGGGSSMSISPGLSHSPNHHSPPFGAHNR